MTTFLETVPTWALIFPCVGTMAFFILWRCALDELRLVEKWLEDARNARIRMNGRAVIAEQRIAAALDVLNGENDDEEDEDEDDDE